jgi:hypothetical protein
MQLRIVDTKTLRPDDGRVASVFTRLGYKFEDAVADLVDNSIDARASRVHIRFLRTHRGIPGVAIIDNGDGMSPDGLDEAMRFGSTTSKGSDQLGKYGIGLKSASLNQADLVTVLTRRNRTVAGRRWTLDNVKKGWVCELLDDGDVGRALSTALGSLDLHDNGTMVLWQQLEHLKALPNTVDDVLKQTTKSLQDELGIRFHRFLDRRTLRISIDQQDGEDEPTGITQDILPLDPFAYGISGDPKYPVLLKPTVQGVKLPTELHIWPSKSKLPGYRLGGGKVASRQGLYFYRNDRLIQAGGWNGIRADDSEPHYSLARVRIELPPELDYEFKLEVTKMGLHPSPEFIDSLQRTRGGSGETLETFMKDAEKAYRKQKTKEAARFPLVPGEGFPAATQRSIASILKERGVNKPTAVTFRWARLKPNELFRVTAGEPEIKLNSTYKKQLAEGGRSDAPVLKLALMFLLQKELQKAFVKQSSEEWLMRVNQAFIETLES